MKSEIIRIIGTTIFWTFFFVVAIIDIIMRLQGYELFFLILRQVGMGFEFLGISLEIAAWRIAKKEAKQQ